MKKFSKLLAVLLTFAVIICPMTSAIVANATSGGSYNIVAENANDVVLTISSNDGFIVYQATVTFNDGSAFQDSYSSDGYTNGLKVIDYTLVSKSKDAYNAPAISAQKNGSSLVILVSATDAATMDLYSEVQIGIRVANGSTANLTKIQAADEGTVEEDPTLLNFGAKVAADGTVDTNNNDNATTGISHEHNFTKTTPYEVTAPTCTTYGVYRRTCETCGAIDSSATYTGTVMADHTPSAVQNATSDFLKTPANCTEPAVYYYECTVCHAAITEEMPGYTGTFTNGAALGHTMTAHAANAATCTAAGNSAYWECTVCHKYFSDAAGNTEIAANSWVVPATGHSYNAVVTAPTCTEAGYTTHTCSVCGDTYTDTPVAALGHDYNAVVTAPTCTEAGYTTHTCSRCDDSYTDTPVAALGHDWVAGAVTAATCTAAGNTHYTCSRCDAEKDEAIAATGHTSEEIAAVAPTCTTVGYTAGTQCSVCGAILSGHEEIPATGHTPVTDPAVAATCVATGKTAGSHCSVCDAVITAQEDTPVDPTNHANIVEDAAVAATCTTTGLTAGSHCAACDTTIVAQSTVPALGHNYTYDDNGDGTHDVACTRCDYSALAQTCVDENDDNTCDLCGASLACDHNYVGVVTTQPTKTSTGVMTYTCSLCGDEYTDTIAIPAATTSVGFTHTLLVDKVVADSITISTKQLRTNYGDSATYFVDVDYETYSSTSDLYNLTNAHAVLTPADKDTSASTANKDVLYFDKMALYEMTLDFDMTLYIKNASGVVVAYRTYESSIADMAYTMAAGNASKTNLLTCLADMCNYGKAVQEYFASTNPTKDIVEAIDPTTVLGDYMTYASDIGILPGAGEYDNTRVQNTKIVNSTGFMSGGMSVSVGSSNMIAYTVRADDYDLDDCEIVMSYTSLYGAKEFTVDNSELIPNGTTSAGKQKYLYNFKNLAIYDANAVVTMSMYHNGVLEMTSQYSMGNFVNSYIEQSSNLGDVMRTMELFANSTAIQLGQGSIFA